MQVDVLGQWAAPVLAFGGPYSNVHALDALLAEAGALGIPPDRMICTGDVAAYGADPAACVAAIRARGIATVAGNVERQLAAGAATCGCGFEAGTTCDVLSGAWYAHADAHTGAGARGWMAGLPDVATLRIGRRRVAVIHGGATDIARFLWPTTPERVLADEIAALEAAAGPIDTVISGHSGIPFIRSVGRVQWINAGVIGLPPNDGAPATRYAVVTEKGAEIRHLAYDAAAARAAMESAGLTQGYHAALTTGLWPSEDVLPPELRRAPVSSC